jgi:hypothetical protein
MKVRVDAGFEGFVFGLGRVGAWDHGLTDVDPAGLVFAEAVEGLIDDARFGGATVNEGQVGFMDFPALLHFAQEGGVLFATGCQKKAAGFTVESADEGKEFLLVVVA